MTVTEVAMTITEEELTTDLSMLQQLPEPDWDAGALDPPCATTGVMLSPLFS
jgi:hypothetical protein